MAAYRPRIVLSSDIPLLFPASVHHYQAPEKLVAKEVIKEKGPMFLWLFRSVHCPGHFAIPETLVKVENHVDPIFILNDDRKGIVCIENKAKDAFFNRVKSVCMMTAVSHPSPMDVPQFVVWTEGRLAYCKEQAEVLRLIVNSATYTIQRFIEPRDEHAKKFRVKWMPGSQIATMITRKIAIPYNKPALRPPKKLKKAVRSLLKPRKSISHSTLPVLDRRKTFTDLAKFQSLAISKGLVTPYTASFSCPEDCSLVPVQRQDLDEFFQGVVRFLQEKCDGECEVLRAVEADVLQDLKGKWYLLTVKSYTVMMREGLAKLRDLHQNDKNDGLRKSPMLRSLEDMKRFFERPAHSSLSHSRYIDLGDVQDQNIHLYSRMCSSLAHY